MDPDDGDNDSKDLLLPSLLRQASELGHAGVLDDEEKEALKEMVKKSNQNAMNWLRKVQDKSVEGTQELKQHMVKAIHAKHELEHACREAQLEELSALLAIFPTELKLAPPRTRPLCLTLAVSLEQVDCRLELGFALPATYPLQSPLRVSCFLPAPFDGREGVTAQALQQLLEKKAVELASAGSHAVFELVELSREWVNDHLQQLQSLAEDWRSQTSLVEDQPKQGSPAPPEFSRLLNELPIHLLLTKSPVITQRARSIMQQVPCRIFPQIASCSYGPGFVEHAVSQAIAKVQSGARVSMATAKELLWDQSWNVEAAIRKGQERQSSGSEAKHGAVAEAALSDLENQDPSEVTEIIASTSLQENDLQRRFTCMVCFDEQDYSQGVCMPCDHWACVDCWTMHLTSKITEGDVLIRCMSHKCKQLIPEEVIMSFCNMDLYRRYRRWLHHSLIKLRGLRWCAGARCDHVALLSDSDAASSLSSATLEMAAGAGGVPGREYLCDGCNKVWCSSCQKGAHWPLTCGMRQAYLSSGVIKDMRNEFKVSMVMEESTKVAISTKNCPKCKTPWWKNGGCNHFSCSCGHQFCWICLEPWQGHANFFACNQSKVDEKEVGYIKQTTGYKKVVLGDSDDVKRVRGYCEREIEHARLAFRSMKLRQNTPALQRIADKLAFDSDDLPVLKASLDLLHEAHSYLRYSYVYLYIYADRFSERELAVQRMQTKRPERRFNNNSDRKARKGKKEAVAEDDEDDDKETEKEKKEAKEKEEKLAQAQAVVTSSFDRLEAVTHSRKLKQEMRARAKEEKEFLKSIRRKQQKELIQKASEVKSLATVGNDDQTLLAIRSVSVESLADALLRDLNMFEYMVSRLDRTFIPLIKKFRVLIRLPQLVRMILEVQTAAMQLQKSLSDFNAWLRARDSHKIRIINYFAEHEARLREQQAEYRRLGFSANEDFTGVTFGR